MTDDTRLWGVYRNLQIRNKCPRRVGPIDLLISFAGKGGVEGYVLVWARRGRGRKREVS